MIGIGQDPLLTSHCSRIAYQRIIHRQPWSLGRIKPVDFLDDWKTGQITALAKKHYEQLYTQFAKFVLPSSPLLRPAPPTKQH